MERDYVLKWHSFSSTLQSVFRRLLDNAAFSDVTLVGADCQLACHKLVLSACSAYFERVLLQHPHPHPLIVLHEVPAAVLRALVTFMYSGEIRLSQDQLQCFLQTAETLKIKGLTECDAGGGGGVMTATTTTLSDCVPPPLVPVSSPLPPPLPQHQHQSLPPTVLCTPTKRRSCDVSGDVPAAAAVGKRARVRTPSAVQPVQLTVRPSAASTSVTVTAGVEQPLVSPHRQHDAAALHKAVTGKRSSTDDGNGDHSGRDSPPTAACDLRVRSPATTARQTCDEETSGRGSVCDGATTLVTAMCDSRHVSSCEHADHAELAGKEDETANSHALSCDGGNETALGGLESGMELVQCSECESDVDDTGSLDEHAPDTAPGVVSKAEPVVMHDQAPPWKHPKWSTILPEDKVLEAMGNMLDVPILAAKLMKNLFTEDERITSNTTGDHGKQIFDKEKMELIRSIVVHVSKVSESDQAACDDLWVRCKMKIDKWNRDLRYARKKKDKDTCSVVTCGGGGGVAGDADSRHSVSSLSAEDNC